MKLSCLLKCFIWSFLLVIGSVSAESNSQAWLPVAVYDFLDDSPNVPVKPANTRASWDQYSLELSSNASQQLQLTWAAQDNIHHYQVMYRVNGGEWLVTTSESTSLTLDPSIEGDVEFRIVGCQSEVLCESYSNEIVVHISSGESQILGLPRYFYVPNVIAAGEPFSILWSSVAGVEEYELHQKDIAGSSAYTLAYTVGPGAVDGQLEYRSTPLENGQYCFKIRTKSQNELSEFSAPLCTSVGERHLDAVSGLMTTSVEPGHYTLSWQPVAHATSYLVEREALLVEEGSEPQGLPEKEAEVSHNVSKVLRTTQQSGLTMTRKWQTVEQVNLTSIENIHTLKTFDLNGEQNYRVSACVEDSCSEATPYYYVVDKEEAVKARPSNIKAEKLSNKSVSVSWDNTFEADSYNIKMKRVGSTWEKVFSNIEEVETTIAVGLPGEYEFSVAACINQGFCALEIQMSGVASFESDEQQNKTPQYFYVEEKTDPNSQIKMTWKAPVEYDNVVAYQIQGELLGALVEHSFTPDANGYMEFTRPTPALGREYCYQVRAKYSDGSYGDYSAVSCSLVGDLAFDAPHNLEMRQISDYEFRLSWDNVAGASKYLVEMQTAKANGETLDPNKWQAIYMDNTNFLKFKLSDFHHGVFNNVGFLAYRVSACDDDSVCGNYKRVYYADVASSAFTSPTPAEHLAPACINVPEIIDSGSLNPVSWCPAQAENVASYEIVGELSSTIATIDASLESEHLQNLFSLNRALDEGREYCYKVRSVFDDGSTSQYTEIQCVTAGFIAFEEPSNFAAKPTLVQANQFELSWSQPQGANVGNISHYLLERQKDVGDWQALQCNSSYESDTWSCIVDLGSPEQYTGLPLIGFRLSACDHSGQCGNYATDYLYAHKVEPVYESSSGNELILQMFGQYFHMNKSAGHWAINAISLQQWQQFKDQYVLSQLTMEYGQFYDDTSREDVRLIGSDNTVIDIKNSATGFIVVSGAIRQITLELLGR